MDLKSYSHWYGYSRARDERRFAHEIKNPLNFVNNFAELSVDLLGGTEGGDYPLRRAEPGPVRAEVDDVVATLTSNLEKITEHGQARRRHREGDAGTFARVFCRTAYGRSERADR